MTRQELLKIAKPILFNTEMVRAIQNDRKTATRRVCHIKINGNTPVNHKLCCTVEYPETNIDGLCANFYDNEHFYKGCAKPPYKVGDYLYVRETWGIYEQSYMDANYILYRADFPNGAKTFGADGVSCDLPTWRPSIHMPKEAARIFLRVTDVRVERLQDMTVDDCLKEGATAFPPPICREEIPFPKGFEHLTKEKQDDWIETTARARYIGWCDFVDSLFRAMSKIWDSTVKKSDLDRYGWEANPWVWVIEFERVEVEP